MEQKPLPPLVSARLFDILRSLDENVAEWVTEDLLSIHDDLVKEEAERSKLMEKITRLEGTTSFETVPKEQYDRTREVLQSLVDAVGSMEHFSPMDDEVCDVMSHPLPSDRHRRDEPCPVIVRIISALSLAKSINIEPTKP